MEVSASITTALNRPPALSSLDRAAFVPLRLHMPYGHFEHRHRFAMWTGARATQRGLASTKMLCGAIEATSVRKFLRDPVSLDIDAKGFESRHREWCNAALEYLLEQGVESVTFGRVAKLFAVYLKAMVVVGESPQRKLSAVIHPPIDRTLLQRLAATAAIDAPQRARWKSVAWTKLTEEEYYSLLAELRAVLADGDPWWKLEEYWNVASD